MKVEDIRKGAELVRKIDYLRGQQNLIKRDRDLLYATIILNKPSQTVVDRLDMSDETFADFIANYEKSLESRIENLEKQIEAL